MCLHGLTTSQGMIDARLGDCPSIVTTTTTTITTGVVSLKDESGSNTIASTNNDSTDGAAGDNKGLLVGVIVGVIGFVVVIAVAVYFKCRTPNNNNAGRKSMAAAFDNPMYKGDVGAAEFETAYEEMGGTDGSAAAYEDIPVQKAEYSEEASYADVMPTPEANNLYDAGVPAQQEAAYANDDNDFEC